MQLQDANQQQRNEIIRLLQSQRLPFEDLPEALQNFYVAMDTDQVVGLIGLERYGTTGLLRSLVVHPEYRNRHIAENLVQLLEEEAGVNGIAEIYLLTETAESYFARKGYTTICRDEVPAAVRTSSEFSHVCPMSATVMRKPLAKKPVSVTA